MPKFLVEIIFSTIQSFLVYVDSWSPGNQKVLHFPQAPSHHILQPATDSSCRPANTSIAMDIDSVSILQQPVQEADSLWQHLYSSFSTHVCSWQPDIGKTFFLVQFHQDFGAHGFWVAVAAPGILNNVRFSLEVHHSCNTQLMLQLDGHVLQLPRATSQPDVWQNPSMEKTLQWD